MAQSAPPAIALARSPEYLMPPSAITGMPLLGGRLHRRHDRGELRHTNTGDDPGGAYRARADSDLDRIGAGIDQRLGTLRRGHVAGDDLGIVAEPAGLLHTFQHPFGMAVGGVDHQHVDAGVEQRLGPGQPLVAGAGGGGDPEPPLFILAGVGVKLGLLDVLDRDQPDTAIVVVHDQPAFRCDAGAAGVWHPGRRCRPER